jgi:hypothetical protein
LLRALCISKVVVARGEDTDALVDEELSEASAAATDCADKPQLPLKKRQRQRKGHHKAQELFDIRSSFILFHPKAPQTPIGVTMGAIEGHPSGGGFIQIAYHQ